MRVLLILAAILLAGCSVPPPADTPSPTTGATVPTVPAATPTDPGAGKPLLRLVDATAEPASVDIGLPVTIWARVANDGDAPGQAVLRVAGPGGDEPLILVVPVDPGEINAASADVVMTIAGAHVASVGLEEATVTVPVHVRAPSFTALGIDARAVEACGATRVVSRFTNSGDGVARDVNVDLVVSEQNGRELARVTSQIGDVPAGETRESEGELAEIKASCEGEEKRLYSVRFSIHASGVASSGLTGIIGV